MYITTDSYLLKSWLQVCCSYVLTYERIDVLTYWRMNVWTYGCTYVWTDDWMNLWADGCHALCMNYRKDCRLNVLLICQSFRWLSVWLTIWPRLTYIAIRVLSDNNKYFPLSTSKILYKLLFHKRDIPFSHQGSTNQI